MQLKSFPVASRAQGSAKRAVECFAVFSTGRHEGPAENRLGVDAVKDARRRARPISRPRPIRSTGTVPQCDGPEASPGTRMLIIPGRNVRPRQSASALRSWITLNS